MRWSAWRLLGGRSSMTSMDIWAAPGRVDQIGMKYVQFVDRIPISGLETGCPTRPNGPAEPSPGLRPEADALGEKGNQTTRPERPQEVLGRSRLAPPRFSRPFRPQGCGAC